MSDTSSDPSTHGIPKFPIKNYINLGLVFWGNCLAITMLYPFVAFQVKDFGVTDDLSSTGFYVGTLIASFFVGRAWASRFWGRLGDSYGRKFVIMCSLLGSMVSLLIYGFASSLKVAILARFLGGAFNGLLPVTKAMASEMTTHPSQQAMAQMIPSASYITSIIVGPAIGGMFCRPCQADSILGIQDYLIGHHPIFCEHPYLLPCLVVVLIHLVLLIPATIALPETQNQGRRRIRDLFKSINNGQEPLVQEVPESSPFEYILITLQCLFILICNQTTLLNSMMMVFPRSEGGAQYAPAVVGYVFTTVGITSLIFQFAIFRYLKSFQPDKIIFWCGLIWIPALLAPPLMVDALDKQGDFEFFPLSWWGFYAFSQVMFNLQLLEMMITTAISMISNSCVDLKQRCQLQSRIAKYQSIIQALIPMTVGLEATFFAQNFASLLPIFLVCAGVATFFTVYSRIVLRRIPQLDFES